MTPAMLKSTVVRTVASCARHARLVVLAAAMLAVVSSVYTVRHFAITTDVSKLISTNDGSSHQHQTSQQATFGEDKILAVVQAPTPELVDQATDRLVKHYPGEQVSFARSAKRAAGNFFSATGFCFCRLKTSSA
jgi:uncharacterized protein